MAINETAVKPNGFVSELRNEILTADGYLEKMSHAAGKKMSDLATDLASSTNGLMKQARIYVKEHPVKSIAIASAAGAVVGCIITLALRARE